MKYPISKGNKVILVPYPAQGHVTPMLKLASVLLLHGLRPVIVTPEFIHSKISNKIDSDKDGILCMAIPDDGLDARKTGHDFFAIETAMEEKMPVGFRRLLRREKMDGETVVCLIVDLLASWAINVGREFGMKVAGFWPAMLTTYKLIDSIPDMILAGIISQTGSPLQLEKPMCSLPSQPNLTTKDLPWLIGNSSSRVSRFKFWTRTMDRSRTLEWILVNTFPAEVITSNNTTNRCDHPRILPVGPLSAHSRIHNSPTFWEEDLSCLDWLNQQTTRSVAYVSFGSWVGPIEKDNVKALALALETCKRPFIWVLAASWRDGLPKGYLERVSKQGRIVAWAPQEHVLQHDAVGCYLTHCGWNSTMEAIQYKKPLLCYPVAGDQFVNCSFIVKKWRIGVQIHDLGPRDVHEGLRSVMEDNEMSERIKRLNEDMITSAKANSRVMAHLTNFISNVTSQCG